MLISFGTCVLAAVAVLFTFVLLTFLCRVSVYVVQCRRLALVANLGACACG